MQKVYPASGPRYMGLNKYADGICEEYCKLKYCCFAPRDCEGCEYLIQKPLKV
jgi:hypothetical protein